MGEAFILRRGSKADAYAVIGVTFPSGSTVSCVNGAVSLKAKGNGTNVYFDVPEAGTWTVTITNGIKIESQAVVISTAGQVEKLNMNFDLELISNGVVQQPSAWTSSGVTAVSGNGFIDLQYTTADYSAGAYIIPVNLTNYNTLTIDAYNAADGNCDYLKVAIKQTNDITNPTTASEYVDIRSKSSRPGTPLTLDVSSKTGTWYVGVYGHGLFYSDLAVHNATARVYNLLLS